MDATKLLETQHQEVKKLFKQIESQGSTTDPAVFEELARNLVAHDAIEREIFYPACEKAMGMTDHLAEALVEHGYVEFGLYQADLSVGEDDFEAKCSVLKEMVLHHVQEEEDEFFPEVRAAIEKNELESLGQQMKKRFEEVKSSDIRELTRQNLLQVMSGKLKTESAKTQPKGSKAPNGTPERAVSR
ncbi:MAG: hemerythrin domain-containing protein [Myxococcota bacterium]